MPYHKPSSRTKQSNKDRKAARRSLIHEAKAQPCADCKQNYPFYVMEFDHRPDEQKRANLSKLGYGRHSVATITAEIAKCDVVCANCHRIRTHGRSDHLRPPRPVMRYPKMPHVPLAWSPAPPSTPVADSTILDKLGFTVHR